MIITDFQFDGAVHGSRFDAADANTWQNTHFYETGLEFHIANKGMYSGNLSID